MTTTHEKQAVSPMVRWKDDEINKIARQVIVLANKEHKDPINHYGLGRTIFEAQTVLPANRQRSLASVTGTKNQKFIIPAIKQQLQIEANQKWRAQQAQQNSIEHKPAETNPLSAVAGENIPKISELVNVGEHLLAPEVKFTPRAVPDEELSPTPSLEETLSAAGRMIADTLVSSFMDSLKAAFAKEMPKLAARALAVSTKLPKILVVGPLQKQQPALEAAVDGIIELKFVSSEERANLIIERGKYCVGAVVWTGFVSHSHTTAVQKMFTNQQFRLVTGTNLDALKATVEDLALHLHN